MTTEPPTSAHFELRLLRFEGLSLLTQHLRRSPLRPSVPTRDAGHDRCWHETDQTGRSIDVRLLGQTGSERRALEVTRLTRFRHRSLHSANDKPPVPECRRRLEPPPSLAQGLRHRHLIVGLPAGHRADGEMKRRLVVLPDSIEQDAGACDVARASQTGLEPGEPPRVALRAHGWHKAAGRTPPYSAIS